MRPNSVKAAVMVAPGRIEAQDFPYPEIGDDAMVSEFARTCESVENLQKLFVLTYADMTAVAPGGTAAPVEILTASPSVTW